MMRILNPGPKRMAVSDRLAPRPSDLNGKVLAFLDNHGEGDKGTPVMNRLYRRYRERMEEKYSFAEVIWFRKPNMAGRATKYQLATVSARADVVINGMCL